MIETARTYPTIEALAGVDASCMMVPYARRQTTIHHLDNRVEFQSCLDLSQRLHWLRLPLEPTPVDQTADEAGGYTTGILCRREAQREGAPLQLQNRSLSEESTAVGRPYAHSTDPCHLAGIPTEKGEWSLLGSQAAEEHVIMAPSGPCHA